MRPLVPTRGYRANAAPVVAVVLMALFVSGCSGKRLVVNQVGNALAESGSTFASDDDPELVRQAVPFSLKLMESLLAESPHHRRLLLATASGFTQYAFAFVQQDADEAQEKDAAAATALEARAKRLYLRARNYGLHGLDVGYRGFSEALRDKPRVAVRVVRNRDVPLLFWTAAAWGSAIGLSKNNPDLIADLPQVEALIDRALELDEAWGRGALHGFLIAYEMNRVGAQGDPAERSRRHFARAVELSNGQDAGPFVSFAESVCVQKQDLKQFDALLEKALAINPDLDPEHRLVNLVMQRRARWLKSRRDELFLIPDSPQKP